MARKLLTTTRSSPVRPLVALLTFLLGAIAAFDLVGVPRWLLVGLALAVWVNFMVLIVSAIVLNRRGQLWGDQAVREVADEAGR